MENSLEGPYKTENRVTIWSNNSVPEHIARNMKTSIQKDMCMPMFIASLFTIAKMWKQTTGHQHMDDREDVVL